MTSSVGMILPNWMENHKIPWFQTTKQYSWSPKKTMDFFPMILMIPTSKKRTMENVGRFGQTGDGGQGIKDLGTTDDLVHVNISDPY